MKGPATHTDEVAVLISFMCSDHKNSSTPAGIKRLMASHSWIRLQDDKGNLYSVGKCGSGELLSPDIFAFKNYPKIAAIVTLAKKQFIKIKTWIQQTMLRGKTAFNLLHKNCSTFSASIAQYLFPTVSATSKIGEHNTFENRVKCFVIAKKIAKLLLDNRASFQDCLNESWTHDEPYLLQTLIQFLSLQSDQGENIQQAIQLLQKTLEQLVEDNIDVALEAKTFIEKELSNEQIVCNKLFNLFSDIYDRTQTCTIDHPYSLFKQLKKQKNVTVAHTK